MTNNLCRICTESGRFLFSLFETKSTANFVELIHHITGVEIKSDDHLPKSICSGCFNDVETTQSLIERCRKSDNILKNKFLQNDNAVSTENVDKNEETSEPQTVQLIDVFETEPYGSELISTEIFNIDDIIEESEVDAFEIDTESLRNEQPLTDTEMTYLSEQIITDQTSELNNVEVDRYPGENDEQSVSDIEPTCLNDLIIADPTAQVAEDQEPNYTQCCGCVEHFSCYEELQEHSKLFHQEDKAICGPVPDNLIECTICYKMFSAISYLDAMHRLNAFKNRIVSVGFPEVIQCCSCDFKATSKEDMLQHSELHLGQRIPDDPSKPFECQFCYKRYKEKQSFSFHQKFSYSYKKQLIAKRRGYRAVKRRTEIESQDNSRKCCGCSAEFRSLDSLKQHSRMHHELYRKKSDTTNPFECEICFKQFPTLVRLEQHRLVPYIRKHKCEHCNKTFLTLNLLQKHMRYHETTEKEPSSRKKDSYEKFVQCDKCGKTFKNKFLLKAHQKSNHSHDKPFSCSLCSKPFKRKDTLQNHLRVHTKEQPYTCKHCPRSFAQLIDKNRHENSHNLEYPLRCSVCDKGFPIGRRQNLERHEKQHETGEEFTC
ncbi:zinc finger protein 250-like [Wyeomyia smithii]|uniref:zinc finger protein 250-like n=1 Tax=Wyeomyia smithii TaxID=174621 RepID=UPI002467FF15|nr:zinc finger protein 250-like [Wyeomyia smithii]